jgi:hypothetical protein
VEIRFHQPPIPFATTPQPPFVLVSHQNTLSEVLIALIQRHVRGADAKGKAKAKAASPAPEWVQELVLPATSDPEGFVAPECFMPLLGAPARSVALYTDQPLSAALRGMSFVEFPTIDVYAPGLFRGTLLDRTGGVARIIAEERPAKRQRVQKNLMGGLLSGYGSDDETAEEENVLAVLEAYSGSEDEGALDVPSKPHGEGTVGATPDGYVQESDYQALLDSMELGSTQAVPDVDEEGEDEGIDWEDEDAEADRQLLADIERRSGSTATRERPK